MANYNYLSNFQGTWSNTTQYQVVNVAGAAQIGLGYVSQPSVIYNSGYYIANGSKQPILGVTPDTDTAWTIVATSSGSTNVLGTVLADFSPTAGVVTASDTVLTAFQKLDFRSYATYVNLNGTLAVGAGDVPFTGGTSDSSSDIVIGVNSIPLAANKAYNIFLSIYVTTAAASGCTIGISSAGTPTAQTLSNAITIGASQNNASVVVKGTIRNGATATTVFIGTSAITGTVSYSNGSITVQQI